MATNQRFSPGPQNQVGLDWLDSQLSDVVNTGLMFAEDVDTTVGLTWGYLGGVVRNGSDIINVNAGTVALTAGTDESPQANYVEIDDTGTIHVNTSGWTPGYLGIRYLTCNDTGVVTNERVATVYEFGGTDAATLGGVASAGYVKTSGSNPFTGPQSMGGYRLTSLADAFDFADGVNLRTLMAMYQRLVAFVNAKWSDAYLGGWNASTNSPALSSGIGVAGTYYKVSTAGTTTLDGVSQWVVGDIVEFNGTVWERFAGNDEPATSSTLGTVKMSTAPASAGSPIAVGDNDSRVPTTGQAAALAGTNGTPGSGNKYVTDSDPRLSGGGGSVPAALNLYTASNFT